MSSVALKHERFGAWCAPLFSVMTVVGFLLLFRAVHPLSQGTSTAGTTQWFARHAFDIELGNSIFALATVVLAIFTIEVTLVLWRREGASPLWSLAQLLGGFAVVMLIFISCCLWIGAAYRAGQPGSGPVTQALNDASWFGFLVGWVMLSLQMVGAAMVQLRDPDLAPRWVPVATLIGAAALATANGCAFTKTGIFGTGGVLGYYIPMVIWGVWLNGNAYLCLRDLRRRESVTDEVFASDPLERGLALAG